MRLTKTSSLPQIKVNFEKYEQFFSKKDKEYALDQPQLEAHSTQIQKITNPKKRAHLKNLQIIEQKGSIKSKVQSYLTDSRKMGILDHTNNETKTRRSMTKISLQTLKTVHTSAEQLKHYLTKLKTQFNNFYDKNQRMEHEIKNCHAMKTQVKQKIIFYEQILSVSWQHKDDLLTLREQNLEYIRYESDRLKFMQERLKEINILMRKRVKDAQNKLKYSEFQAKNYNEIEGIKQDKLDNEIYLLKHYEGFQNKKSENLNYKTQKAMLNMKQNQTTWLLKKHQESITIMDKQDYDYQVDINTRTKLNQDIVVVKFYSKMLDSTWNKYSSYYESYEKAELTMKMHALDRKCLVQDSYKNSFQIKSQMQITIKQKQLELQVIQQQNKRLKKISGEINFQEIQEIQKKIQNMKIQYKTGKQLLKTKELQQKYAYFKKIIQRQQEIDKAKSLSLRLLQWMKKQQKTIKSEISKRQPLEDHLNFFIQKLFSQLKDQEPYYNIKTLAKSTIELPNKSNFKGSNKKRK